MKLFLASVAVAVAVALAGNTTPSPLPTKLPAEVAGFTFGDSLAQIEGKCAQLGPGTDSGKPRFITRTGWASCADVRTGKSYMPAVAPLLFMLQDGRVVSISASDLPMATLIEYARQIARGPKAVVEGTHYCRTFADGVGGVCVDLETKILMLTIES